MSEIAETTVDQDPSEVSEEIVVTGPQPREIQIRRKENDTTYFPPSFVQGAQISLSSVLDGQAPLKGLTQDQEKKYLPQLLGIHADDRDFPSAVRDFWASLSLKVPSEGAVLQVGTDANGEPLNVRQWVIYQWALKHKLVVDTKEDLGANAEARFYIHDPVKAEQGEAQDARQRMQALRELLNLQEDPKKLRFVLRLLGNINPDSLNSEKRLILLEGVAQNNPRKFLAAVNDKNLEAKAFLAELVANSVITKIGTVFTYMDQTLGESETQAVHFLNNKRNSQVVNELKAKLKAALNTMA